MTATSSRNLKIAAASLLAIFFVAYLCFRPGPGPEGGGKNGRQPSARAGDASGAPAAPDGDANRRSRPKDPGSEIVPADAPEVVAAIQKIKHLEEKRIEFDREIVKDNDTLHEFYLKAPSPAEAEEISRIISSVHGFAKDDGQGVKSWQEKLRAEYVMPPQYEGCVVTASFDASSPTAFYQLNGIPVGKFARRDNGGVVSSDRSLYVGYASPVFPSDSDWRFSYLYKDKGDSGK